MEPHHSHPPSANISWHASNLADETFASRYTRSLGLNLSASGKNVAIVLYKLRHRPQYPATVFPFLLLFLSYLAPVAHFLQVSTNHFHCTMFISSKFFLSAVLLLNSASGTFCSPRISTRYLIAQPRALSFSHRPRVLVERQDFTNVLTDVDPSCQGTCNELLHSVTVRSLHPLPIHNLNEFRKLFRYRTCPSIPSVAASSSARSSPATAAPPILEPLSRN